MSPARRVTGGIFLAIMVVAVAAMFLGKLLPTPLGTRVAQALGALVGVVMAWAARDGGMLDAASTGSRSWLLKAVWSRAPLFGIFGFFMTFAAVQGGALALVTAAVGQPATRTLTIKGVGGGGRSCRHFEVREVGFLFDRALCASPDQLDQAIDGRKLVVTGKGSPFGVNVESLELGPAP